MAIILEAAYSKKLGLPNYSSHSFVVSIRTELSDLTQVEAESARLYALLQQSVDNEIRQVGFLPDATTLRHERCIDAPPQQPTVDQPAIPTGTIPLKYRRRDQPLEPDRPDRVGVFRTSRRNSSSSWSNSTVWISRRSKPLAKEMFGSRSRRSTVCKPAG